MAFNAGTTAKVYANGYDLSGYLKGADSSASREMYDSTTLGDSDREYVAGLRDASFSADGLFEADSTAPKVDDILHAAMGNATAVILTHLPYGDGLGNRGIGMDGDESSYEVSSPVDDLVSVALEVQSSVGREAIRVLHPIGAETATGNGTGLDNSASSANGGSAYLQVTAASGTAPSLTAKVQHSADDITYADLITFDAATAIGAQRKSVAGTVNRYTRARHEISGTGPSFTYHLGFNRRP